MRARPACKLLLLLLLHARIACRLRQQFRVAAGVTFSFEQQPLRHDRAGAAAKALWCVCVRALSTAKCGSAAALGLLLC
jgi:hypothetical protein